MKANLKEIRGWKFILAMAGLFLMLLLVPPAQADKYWVGPNPDENWSNANNWSTTAGGGGGAGEPTDGETAYLTQSDGGTRTVLYDSSTMPFPVLNQVRIDAIGSGSITLQQSANYLYAKDEYVGYSGTGSFTQTGGTNALASALLINPDGTLYLGYSAGSSGTYNLGGTGMLRSNLEYIGYSGSGAFIQSGGTGGTNNIISSELYLGYSAGSSGAYTLSGGGTLSVTQAEIVGNAGTGSFTQTGGYNIITYGYLVVGKNGGSGTYSLSGNGSLTVQTQEVIGYGGTGVFDQTGGTNTISVGEGHGLFVGVGGSGIYNLSGADSILFSCLLKIGESSGTGIFNQTGGTNSVIGNLILAADSGSSGTYNLEGGTLAAGAIQVNSGGALYVTGVGDKLVTTVTGDVTNKGTVKTTNADVTWEGTFTVTEGGVYHSDPSTQTFKDFRVEAEGCVMAASQDTFVIKNNFTNLSSRSDEWATDQAILQFVALDDDITHNLSLPGADLGPTPAGYDDNFAWGKLILGELDEDGKIKPGTEQTVHLFDGNETAGGALYVGEIKGLLFEDDLITNIYGHGLNIYYHPNLPGNEYLGGLTYAFMDAGQLIATPVPASILLLGSGLLGLGLLGWRRKLG